MTNGQACLFDAIYRKLHSRLLVLCYTQYGKEISHDIPVLTINGWKNHGDLVIGDYVFNEKGKPVRVNALLGETNKNEYVVDFSNGESITCHAKHEWVVKKRSWKDFRKMETEALFNQPIRYDGVPYYNYVLPEIEMIDFGRDEVLPIDSYFFGAWLGDGTTGEPTISGVESDIKHIKKSIHYPVSSFTIHKKTGVHTVRFYKNGLKMPKRKYIPEEYKRASIEDRKKLIAGLIDSDGSVNKKEREKGWKNGRIYITNTNKTLIDDVKEVLQSLGIRNVSIVKVPACESSSGIKGKKDVYYLGFSPTINFPTNIPRKKITVRNTKRSKTITITGIVKTEPKKGRCINVEGGIYLVGRGLIPTHNSDVVSMAVLTRITTFPERWCIIGGTEDKAKIIMNKLIGHIFDNEYTKSKLNMKNFESVERLRHERSRSRLTFSVGDGIGEVFILSGDSSKKGQDAGDTMVGHGAANIIADDAPLLSDTVNAKIARMLGGFKDNFYMKIGNALNRNHFFRAFQADKYTKIIIDHHLGIEEGRQTKEFFDDVKEEMNDDILFNSFYACIFPPADSAVGGVWVPLFTENDIIRAQEETPHFGEKKLGVDVADSGEDHDVIVSRSNSYAEILYDNQNSDQMRLAGMTILKHKEIDAGRVYVDRNGVGAGLCSRLRELKFPHRGINYGEKSGDGLFSNKKAELFWAARRWINQGGKLSKDKRWLQLANVMYSVSESNGKIQIMPKKIALNMGIKSPDVADAFAMTFTDRDKYNKNEEERDEEFFKTKMKKKTLKKDSNYALKMTN